MTDQEHSANQVLMMIDRRLAALERLPEIVAGLSAKVDSLQQSWQSGDAANTRRLTNLEVRVRLLEDKVGAIDPEKANVSSRLCGLEENIGKYNKVVWGMAMALAVALAPEIFRLLAKLLNSA
jgi:hypothetical protein